MLIIFLNIFFILSCSNDDPSPKKISAHVDSQERTNKPSSKLMLNQLTPGEFTCLEKEIKIPEAVFQFAKKPLYPCFGYNPNLAIERYGQEIEWINFDPNRFLSESDSSQKALEALGYLISHTTQSYAIPIWALLNSRAYERDVSGSIFDGMTDGQRMLRKFGHLPSPYRYQLDNKVPIQYLEISSTSLGTRRSKLIPFELSLTNTLYKVNSETKVAQHQSEFSEPGIYSANNCMDCHGGTYKKFIIGGAPNKNHNVEWAFRNHEDSGLKKFYNAWNTSEFLATNFINIENILRYGGINPQGIVFLDIPGYQARFLANTIDYYFTGPRVVLNSATNETTFSMATTAMVYEMATHFHLKGESLDSWHDIDEIRTNPSSMYNQYLNTFRQPTTEHGG